MHNSIQSSLQREATGYHSVATGGRLLGIPSCAGPTRGATSLCCSLLRGDSYLETARTTGTTLQREARGGWSRKTGGAQGVDDNAEPAHQPRTACLHTNVKNVSHEAGLLLRARPNTP